MGSNTLHESLGVECAVPFGFRSQTFLATNTFYRGGSHKKFLATNFGQNLLSAFPSILGRLLAQCFVNTNVPGALG